jgi:nucleotide-binding universal stress UspA family protein
VSVVIKDILVKLSPDPAADRAADSAAGLVVMGGYGHSRMRQFILGASPAGCWPQ